MRAYRRRQVSRNSSATASMSAITGTYGGRPENSSPTPFRTPIASPARDSDPWNDRGFAPAHFKRSGRLPAAHRCIPCGLTLLEPTDATAGCRSISSPSNECATSASTPSSRFAGQQRGRSGDGRAAHRSGESTQGIHRHLPPVRLRRATRSRVQPRRRRRYGQGLDFFDLPEHPDVANSIFLHRSTSERSSVTTSQK